MNLAKHFTCWMLRVRPQTFTSACLYMYIHVARRGSSSCGDRQSLSPRQCPDNIGTQHVPKPLWRMRFLVDTPYLLYVCILGCVQCLRRVIRPRTPSRRHPPECGSARGKYATLFREPRTKNTRSIVVQTRRFARLLTWISYSACGACLEEAILIRDRDGWGRCDASGFGATVPQ